MDIEAALQQILDNQATILAILSPVPSIVVDPEPTPSETPAPAPTEAPAPTDAPVVDATPAA